MEFKELRKLNNLEKIYMIKEYIGVYLALMLKNDKEKQKKLLKSLKKYLETIKIENEIYKFLEENQDKISDQNESDKLLDQIDLIHERTYKYYDKILLNCEENYDREYDIIPYQDFNTIVENDSMISEIKGLTLTIDDIKAFYNDEQVEILIKKLKIIDENEKKSNAILWCFSIRKRWKTNRYKNMRSKNKKFENSINKCSRIKAWLRFVTTIRKNMRKNEL